MSDNGQGQRTILVVHGDKKTQRTVHRILGGTFCPIEIVATLAEAEAKLATEHPFLLVVDHEMVLHEAGRAVLARRAGAPVLVLMHDPEPDDLSAMLGVDHLSYLMANSMPLLAEEMSITALKLIRGEIWGLEKYMAWGVEIRERVLTDASDRSAAIQDLDRDVHQAGFGPRVAAQATLIADELLSNALYNAPLDPAGERYRGDEPRHGTRPLVGREQVTLRYACDARYFAIEVTDRFGSLDRKTILRCLAKAGGREPEKVSMATRGAGIGLATVYGTCNHLVFNLEPGVRTEVVALIDVRFRPSELTNAVCSFGVFAV
jgi:CheY-like chemotaxis protein/anti-sigma regulatory factor (Ser/Thr protein kinase)